MSARASIMALRQVSVHASGLRRISMTSNLQMAKKIIMVPTMGDSITEGTIVEWTAQPGQAVKTDDVIALVETDKVTIEIKSVVDGVLTQQFGAVDETVAVGAKLYEIDTEGEATFVADTTSPSVTPTTNQSDEQQLPVVPFEASAESITTASSYQDHTRTPSIFFLGKEGWAARKIKGEKLTAAAQSTSPHGVTVVQDDSVRHPMYGRPPFSEAEMEALLCGGANLTAGWKIRN